MSQPSDKPTEKRADELRIGDYIHDGRGIGPVEITHTQKHRNPHGDPRILIVTGDAAVSYHVFDQVFPLATDAEIAEGERRLERVERIADIRAFADWLEAHPDVPAPNGVRAQASLFGPWLDQVELLEKAAKAMGLEVERKLAADGRPTASVHAEIGKTNFVVYGSDDRRDPDLRRCEVCGEDLALIEAGRLGHVPGEACASAEEPAAFVPQDQTLPHYEASGWKGGANDGDCGVECACGLTYDGFDTLAEASAFLAKHIEEGNAAAVVMRETPLDELPADLGADHQPELDCCEDCDAELDAAAEADAADDANTRAGVA